MIQIPFTLHSFSGSVEARLSENKDPKKWGYNTLFKNSKSLEEIKTFPVCTATIDFKGEGYNSMMGWVQIVTYTKSGDKNPTVIVDHPPQSEDSNSPFLFWGSLPALFDAPSMLTGENKRMPSANWRADSFLVATPDALMSKVIAPIASFSWGFQTDKIGKVTISELQNTKLETWNQYLHLLKEKYSKWDFKKSL